MALCDYCKQEMLTASGCMWAEEHGIEFPDGTKIDAIPHAPIDAPRCADCNVQPEECHHPGCDQEECPRCGGQILSCECFYEPDEDMLIDMLTDLLHFARAKNIEWFPAEERARSQFNQEVYMEAEDAPPCSPHDLECTRCCDALNNQCLDPTCQETESHPAADLICGECQQEEEENGWA